MSPLKLLQECIMPSEKMRLRMKLKAPHQKNCWKSWRRSKLWWSSCNIFCSDLNIYDTETSSSVLSFVYFLQKWKFLRRIFICWPSSCDLPNGGFTFGSCVTWVVRVVHVVTSFHVLKYKHHHVGATCVCWLIFKTTAQQSQLWFSIFIWTTGNDANANAANTRIMLHHVSSVWRAQGQVLCCILLDKLGLGHLMTYRQKHQFVRLVFPPQRVTAVDQ